MFGLKKKVTKDLATFNKGNPYQEFYFSHKSEIDKRDKAITNSRIKSGKEKDAAKRLKELYHTKALLDSFHSWCLLRKNGEAFWKQHYANGERSMYQRVLKEIDDLEK